MNKMLSKQDKNYKKQQMYCKRDKLNISYLKRNKKKSYNFHVYNNNKIYQFNNNSKLYQHSNIQIIDFDICNFM